MTTTPPDADKPTVAQLVDEGVHHATAYQAGDTEAARRLAAVVARLRSYFPDSRDPSRPDMRGRSHEYKEVARALYQRAGLDDTAQARLRHHVSSAVRTYMRDELGMTDADFVFYRLNPEDRNTVRRAAARTSLPALRLPVGRPDEVHLAILAHVRRALDMPADFGHAVTTLSPEVRAELRREIDAVSDQIAAMRDALDDADRRSRR